MDGNTRNLTIHDRIVLLPLSRTGSVLVPSGEKAGVEEEDFPQAGSQGSETFASA